MRQVWPPPTGGKVVNTCMTKNERLAFSHPGIMTELTLGLGAVFLGTPVVFESSLKWVGVALVAVAVALLGMALVGLIHLLREDRIARTGESTYGTVTNLRAAPMQIGYRRPYWLTYTYADGRGTEHTGKVRVVGQSWEGFAGTPVLFRYDPQHPEQSAIVWNTLGQTTYLG